MARYTLQQLQNIEAAYAEGVLRVKIGDRDVTYHSRAEMRELIMDIRADLGIVDTTRPGPLVFNTMSYDRGAR